MSLTKYESKRSGGITGHLTRIIQDERVQHAVKKHGPKVARGALAVAKWGYDALMSRYGSRSVNAGGGPAKKSQITGHMSAPVAVGTNVKGMQYSFHSAPDIGLGPGLRLVAAFRVPAVATGLTDGTNSSGWFNGTQYDPMLVLDPSQATCVGAHIAGQNIPCIFNLESGLQNLCKMFERFLFRHVSIEMVPIQNTAFSGAVAIGYYRDAPRLDAQVTATTGTSYNLALSVPNGVGAPNWEPMKLTLLDVPDRTPVSMADAFYIHSEDTAEAGVSAGRLETQGAAVLGFVNTAANNLTAQPFGHCVLDLYCPATNVTGVVLADGKQHMPKFIGAHSMERELERLLRKRETQTTEHKILGADTKSYGPTLSKEESDQEDLVLVRPAVLARTTEPCSTPPKISVGNTVERPLTTRAAQAVGLGQPGRRE